MEYQMNVQRIDLGNYEKKTYSQNGEDGIIEKIFEIIGTVSKYYVEFGAENGVECNTRNLRQKHHWQGLLMDGGYQNLSINLQKAFINAENINQLFHRYGVPFDFDLLSIDIDYNDFHVWNALSDRYRPRVVVIEYNATHLPFEDKVVEYGPNTRWDGTNYFGASIRSYYLLGRKKAYSLVYAENHGVNLFFIRDDVLKECSATFKNVNCVSQLYKYPRYGSGPNGGHPVDPLNRSYSRAVDLLNLSDKDFPEASPE
jgi:hypothetical protein